MVLPGDPMRHATCIRLIGAILAALPCASAIASEPSLDRLITQLNDDSFNKRQQATEALYAPGSSFKLKQIEAELARADLTPEQRVRLCQAGEQLFFREPRGALGVSWDNLNGPRSGRGAFIGGCIENFDSMRVLKPGDAIVAIGSTKFEENRYDLMNSISAEILSHDPGDEVTISVIRDGHRVNVTCKIGNYSDLPRMQMGVGRRGPDSSTLSEAWSRRLERLAALGTQGQASSVLRPPLLPAGWTQARAEMQRSQHDRAVGLAQQAKAQGIDPAAVDVEGLIPFLVAAGEPRGLPEQAMREANPFGEPEMGVRREGVRFQRPDMRRITDIQSEINRQLSEMQTAMTMLMDPGLGKPQRASAQQRVDLAQRRIEELRSQLRQAGVGIRVDE